MNDAIAIVETDPARNSAAGKPSSRTNHTSADSARTRSSAIGAEHTSTTAAGHLTATFVTIAKNATPAPTTISKNGTFTNAHIDPPSRSATHDSPIREPSEIQNRSLHRARMSRSYVDIAAEQQRAELTLAIVGEPAHRVEPRRVLERAEHQ